MKCKIWNVKTIFVLNKIFPGKIYDDDDICLLTHRKADLKIKLTYYY